MKSKIFKSISTNEYIEYEKAQYNIYKNYLACRLFDQSDKLFQRNNNVNRIVEWINMLSNKIDPSLISAQNLSAYIAAIYYNYNLSNKNNDVLNEYVRNFDINNISQSLTYLEN